MAQASADVERIHSHHADPREIPVVTLVFETQSGLYRVRRTPRFERPKSRGSGLTVQQPSVKLWRITSPDDLDGGELLSTNIGDCDDEITRAVGLTRDQFVQTVILPQGEFATFLRARSEDKGKLLEKVFGTAFFRRVQEEIVEAGRAAQARRQGAVARSATPSTPSPSRPGSRRSGATSWWPWPRRHPVTSVASWPQVVDELATRERHAAKASREAIEAHRQMAEMVNTAKAAAAAAAHRAAERGRVAGGASGRVRPAAGPGARASGPARRRRAHVGPERGGPQACRQRLRRPGPGCPDQRELTVAEPPVAASSTREVVGALTAATELEGASLRRTAQLEQARPGPNEPALG